MQRLVAAAVNHISTQYLTGEKKKKSLTARTSTLIKYASYTWKENKQTSLEECFPDDQRNRSCMFYKSVYNMVHENDWPKIQAQKMSTFIGAKWLWHRQNGNMWVNKSKKSARRNALFTEISSCNMTFCFFLNEFILFHFRLNSVSKLMDSQLTKRLLNSLKTVR